MKYKFRAYNKETKTMILLDPYQWSLTALNEEENWKVMMWTGLLDRHGTEIYESDIVRAHRFIQVLGANYGVSDGEEINICTVKYRDEDACFIFVPEEERIDVNYLNAWDFSDEGVEVIGNIYEN